MMHLFFACLLACQGEGPPASLPLTVAETSGFERTSSHEDVLRFLDALSAAGAPLRVETIGETAEGRPIPLVILSDPALDAPPDPATRDRIVVCIQANIHGGEVDGKEASLMLLRDIALGDKRHLLENLVLLVVPDYNPDGNDAFGPTSENRRSQSGPDPVGRRYNGQGLDLNRDCMKARSPEFRAVLTRILRPWDPEVFLDLHTTNGSYHAYPLLYAPHLHPGGPPGPLVFARETFLPSVRRAMRTRHGLEVFDYGNFDSQANPTRWATYDYKARMCWNYIGLRGRIGILSEAFAYAPFRNRVEATYHFVEEVLRFASEHARVIRELRSATDRQIVEWGNDPATAPPVALEGSHAKRPVDEMVLVEQSADPPEGQRRRVRLGLIQGKLLPVYDRFDPEAEIPLPRGYLLRPDHEEIVEHLRLHGIRVERLTEPWSGEAESWKVTELDVRDSRWEGGRHLVVKAVREATEVNAPEGSFVVLTAQPLGLLAVHLLEPTAPDSVVAWGVAGIEPVVGQRLPYFRLPDGLPSSRGDE